MPQQGDAPIIAVVILQRQEALLYLLSQNSLLVTLVKLVDRVPMPPLPTKRDRGYPIVYSDRLFLKALVIKIIRHLHNVQELLSMLAQPTEEMCTLQLLLTQQEGFPSRRTWERRLKAIPATLPAMNKGVFDGHGQVPIKDLISPQRFALGAIFVYQISLLYCFEHGWELRVGLKVLQ